MKTSITQCRNSNGIVFSIGNKVIYKDKSAACEPFIISRFALSRDGKQIHALSSDGPLAIIEFIDDLELFIETPLITKDYFPVFHNSERLHALNTKSFTVYSESAHNAIMGQWKEVLFFKSKQALDNYVERNKPMYSEKDIEMAYTAPIESPLYKSLIENLKNNRK